MCVAHKIAAILVLIGALNWGLVGALEIDLVAMLLGAGSLLARIVYVAVGLSAILMLMKHKCKACMAEGGMKKEAAPAMDAPSDAPQA